MSVRAVLCLVAALPLVACAPSFEDETSSACDANPELGIAPRALTGNGVQSNGIQANGIQANGIQINGVQLNAAGDGRIAVNGTELGVGATVPAVLTNGSVIDLVVTAIDGRSYELSYEGKNVCPNGEKGIFVPGVWDARGARHDSSAQATYSCASGAIAKCVRWGYDPSEVGAALHQTCTRMVRADYCGNGIAHTKDGTAIDIFDAQQINEATNEDGFLFEAGWGENGATCVSRTRFDAHDPNGERLLPSCWKALPSCSSFDEAQTHGALIGNASRVQSRSICN